MQSPLYMCAYMHVCVYVVPNTQIYIKWKIVVDISCHLPMLQGLKRSEQHVLTELFKSKVITNNADLAAMGEKGGLIQPIKKLERLMRSAI